MSSPWRPGALGLLARDQSGSRWAFDTIGVETTLALQRRATVPLFRLLSLLFLAGAVTTCIYAQDPVSPNLAPPLTDNPDSQPTTTLAIDLLAPQRPFIFDPTGASVSANALDPSIFASSLGSSLAQTDTQLRDSSQSGRISPYAQAAQRLGINIPSDESSGAGNGSLSDGSFRSALPGADSGSGQQHVPGDSYQSSWGGSSSFGGSPGAQAGDQFQSSWGTERLRNARSVGRQSDTLRTTPDLSSESAGANSTGFGGGTLAANGDGSRSGQTGFGSSRSREPSSGSRSSSSFQSGQLRSMESSSENKPGQLTRYDATLNDTLGTGGGATGGNGPDGASKDKTAAANALTFFPAAYAEPFTLGRSPFSSPSGLGELHFFTPNILAATSRGYTPSMNERGSANPTDNSLRQAFVHRHTLATSTSHYGLATHPSGMHSFHPTSDQSLSGGEKRTHLPTSILDSENP